MITTNKGNLSIFKCKNPFNHAQIKFSFLFEITRQLKIKAFDSI